MMRIIRASEIGEYVFCHRAWWLHHIQGVESANRVAMQFGVTRHHQHGRAVQRALWLHQAALVCAGLAIVCAVVAILFSAG